jgi:arylsulfatase A-like enzyme
VSLLTGLNQAHHRVTQWVYLRDQPPDLPHPTLVMPEWNCNGLQPSPGVPRSVHASTLPALLRDAGYRTIHIGKGHLGATGTPGEDPKTLGFDVRIGVCFRRGCKILDFSDRIGELLQGFLVVPGHPVGRVGR